MILFLPVLGIFAWMAWSVCRMSQLPVLRRMLPSLLLTAALLWWVVLRTSGPVVWWSFCLPVGLAVASWAVSLAERRLSRR
ncbi:hypothetical protein [Streptomyces sp. NBC_00847]|uniref:hypothetical protein n=1 Tax=unclassified Streptomyces TaxID=2593676 RepID=UPI002258C33A|nr:hypothetical protein [Streptomyces sp. NBC_00847]MCX4880566.1 hypothetical protein [Streptomyces sp. NBC_00847]